MSTNKSKATEKKWETISVELIKLHLDLENYRHEPVENEENAIAKLYTHEKVEAIVRDIVEYGAISPLDRIGVIPMPRATRGISLRWKETAACAPCCCLMTRTAPPHRRRAS